MEKTFGSLGLLAVVFITLKLLDKINWSWVWVLSPIWIGFSILIAVTCITMLLAYIFYNSNK